jgi:hypothetical protein
MPARQARHVEENVAAAPIALDAAQRRSARAKAGGWAALQLNTMATIDR